MPNEKNRIVAVVSDLMFTVKIQEAAKRAGLETVFVKSREAALAQAKQNPAVIILDLNGFEVDPLELITMLKNDPETSTSSAAGLRFARSSGFKAGRTRGGLRCGGSALGIFAEPAGAVEALRGG